MCDVRGLHWHASRLMTLRRNVTLTAQTGMGTRCPNDAAEGIVTGRGVPSDLG